MAKRKTHNKGRPALTLGGVTGKFRRMCDVYVIFAREWAQGHDFSDTAKVELYNHESYGTPLHPHNGYALGKKWLNVQVTMWYEDMAKGMLFKHELYQDPLFPHWWLDSLFKDKHIRVDRWWLRS